MVNCFIVNGLSLNPGGTRGTIPLQAIMLQLADYRPLQYINYAPDHMNPQTKLFKTGVHLFHENDRSRELYVIQSGNVKVYRTQSGREVELAVMGKGSVLGEMALIDGRPRSASAKALDECTVSIIDADVFHSRIKGVPPWFMTIIKMTSQKIRNANRLLQSMSGGRHGFNIILAFHYQFAKEGDTLDYSKTKHALARLLGISEQSITRIGEFLEKHGFIECCVNTIVLANTHRMTDYCDFLRLHIQKTFDHVHPPSQAAKDLIVSIADRVNGSSDMQAGNMSIKTEGEVLWDIVSELQLEKTWKEEFAFFEGNSIAQLSRREGEENGAHEGANPLALVKVTIDKALLRQWHLYCSFNEMIPEP
jgi:CRP-like cAMP-binding protein